MVIYQPIPPLELLGGDAIINFSTYVMLHRGVSSTSTNI